jgi:hypothetical protein
VEAKKMNFNDIEFIQETFEKGYERYVRKLNNIKLAKGKTKEGKQNAKLQLQRR